ncbi:Aminoacylase-1A [Porphyridium purpureum]|uniref:N-acyl-aliphatic-L-amino acid amidohydrolase n=1 Tax=Porphyridium purpureum TaxID=35688 RepID=A0A5J4YZ44_PORPP|nr:Aminoacylase-1A [Porphyridium purpureum]|eukprot:POR0274..scf208_2
MFHCRFAARGGYGGEPASPICRAMIAFIVAVMIAAIHTRTACALTVATATATVAEFDADAQQVAIANLQRYLQLDTAQPSPAYASALTLLTQLCFGVPNMKTQVSSFVRGKPVLVCSIAGDDPDAPSVMLNSHTDVVAAGNLSSWDFGPFDAERVPSSRLADALTGDDHIVARGAQDMKSVGIQYLEALKLLYRQHPKRTFRRTIHVVFVPDEEIGGADGMGNFVESEWFQRMNVGVSCDEGIASPTDEFELFLAERRPFWTRISVQDVPGHGAMVPKSTATLTLTQILANVATYRKRIAAEIASGEKDLGEIVSVNINHVSAGQAHAINVIPEHAVALLDIRVPPFVSAQQVEELIASWMPCAGCGIDVSFLYRVENGEQTSLDEDENPWAAVFKEATSDLKLRRPSVFFGATDGRYLRAKKIPVFGFSPMRNTPVLLHKFNEHLSTHVFLEGITVYSRIIATLANAPVLLHETVEKLEL